MGTLEIRGLKKRYPEFTMEVDLTVNEGEFLTIIGPSGSGKSTLLNLISGLESPDEGSILLDGKDICALPVQKRGISMVFQDYALFSSMNVEKNISYAMKIRKVKRSERRRQTDALLSFVNLSGYNRRKVTTLSGGEAQRVALARALSSDPAILLLDEPLSALDAALRRHLRDEVRRIHDENPGVTTIYVTHDREEAFSISDRIAIMNGGHIEMVAGGEEIYNQPASLFTAFFTGEGTSLPAHLVFENSDGSIFFRPENAVISEENINPAMYPMHVIFNDLEVVSEAFMGSGYLLGMEYQGYPMLSLSHTKPRKKQTC